MKPVKNMPIDFNIINHGAPIVQYCDIREVSDKLIAIQIALKSKYCECGCFSITDEEPIRIYIHATDNSFLLDESKPKDEPTCIELTSLTGWDVFATGNLKYTINVCLIKL